MILQSLDANRSNSNILDLSKLKDYNFTAVNLSASSNDIENTVIPNMISAITSNANFGASFLDSNTTVVSATNAINIMKNYVGNSSIKYDKKFTVDYLNGRTLYREYVGFNEQISPINFNLNQQTSFLDENVNPSVTRTDSYQAMDGMIRIIDGKIYEYTTDAGHYNDGINIYTISSIDNTKIICSVQIPGQVITVNFYFNNPN